MNKKADAKLLSIWWFVVIVMIAVGVVIATLMFFSSKIDVRNSEVDLIVSRVIDCMSEGSIILGEINEGDFLDKCFLNKLILNSQNYMLIIEITNSRGYSKKIIYGNNAFDKDCDIGAAMRSAKNYPLCTEKETNITDSKGSIYLVKVKGGSNYEYRLKES